MDGEQFKGGLKRRKSGRIWFVFVSKREGGERARAVAGGLLGGQNTVRLRKGGIRRGARILPPRAAISVCVVVQPRRKHRAFLSTAALYFLAYLQGRAHAIEAVQALGRGLKDCAGSVAVAFFSGWRAWVCTVQQQARKGPFVSAASAMIGHDKQFKWSLSAQPASDAHCMLVQGVKLRGSAPRQPSTLWRATHKIGWRRRHRFCWRRLCAYGK